MPTLSWALEVSKDDLSRFEIPHEPCPPLAEGELLARIEHLAFTANTLTYAAMGDALGYWSLFPAAAPGFGRIPAWGHARVVESEVDDVPAGQLLFGLLPMASHVVLGGRRSRLGLRETRPHRRALPAVYNQYALRDGGDETALELRALLHPLFITSFVLAHHLVERDFLDADEVVVASASSKTALGLAHRLKGARRIVGLTSSRHAGWLARTGLHDAVCTYEALAALDGDGRRLLVDFSGNRDIEDRVVQRLGDRHVRTIRVGATHGGALDLAPAGGETFSGPRTIEALVGRWGPQAFDLRLDEALASFTGALRGHFELRHFDGEAGLAEAYAELQRGLAPPSRLLVARPSATTHASR